MRNPFRLKTEPGSNIPNEVYGYRPYLIAFAATWASAAFGYDAAFIGGTISLPSFKRKFALEGSTTEVAALSSNIVSTFQAGAFFGAIIGFLGAEKLGRKKVIILAGMVFIVGVILQMIGQLGLLYGGRALTGLGIGASSTMIPIYISECSPALIRGRLVGMFEVMLQIALVFGFWVNYGVAQNISPTTDKQWRIPVAVQFIPSGLLLCFMPWVIESPRWLVSKNRVDEARKALSWVRNLPEDHEYIVNEMNEIQIGVAHELEISGGHDARFQVVRELFAKGVRWRAAMAPLLMLLQNLMGINAINYYSPVLLQSIGYTGTEVSLLATGVYGIVKMAACVFSMLFIVDRYGRRPILIIGAVGATISMYYLAGYAAVSGSFDHKVPSDGGSKAALAMIYIFAICHSFSWTGVPWIFASEVLPNKVRTIGMMCSVCMQWLAQFLVVYSLPYMVVGIKYGTFIFFGTCTVAALIFAILFVPETKGVPLEDMDLLFGADAPLLATAARRKYDETKRAGLNSTLIYQAEGKGPQVEMTDV